MSIEAVIAPPARAPLDEAGAQRLSEWLKGYRPIPGVPDELFDATGRPRDYWLEFLGDLADYPAGQIRNRFKARVRPCVGN